MASSIINECGRNAIDSTTYLIWKPLLIEKPKWGGLCMKRSIAITLTAIFASLAFAVRFFWIGVIPFYATMKLDLRGVFVLIGSCLVPPQYAAILGFCAGLGSGIGFDDLPFISNAIVTSSIQHTLRFKNRHFLAMLGGQVIGQLIFFTLYVLGGMVQVEILPVLIPTFFVLRSIPNYVVAVIVFSALLQTKVLTSLGIEAKELAL